MEALMATVRTVVDLIVRGEFETLESMTRGRRLTASELRASVEAYGRKLARPPEEAWEEIDVVEVESESRIYNVHIPLWTEEEGRSDLTLELTLTEFAPGLFSIEVDGIHVL
ncbi:MAG TPA: hypothetical protein VF058_06425 [Actinomycetota bacterium]